MTFSGDENIIFSGIHKDYQFLKAWQFGGLFSGQVNSVGALKEIYRLPKKSISSC